MIAFNLYATMNSICGELNKMLKHICVISANGNGQTALPVCDVRACVSRVHLCEIEAIGTNWGRWEMTFGNHIVWNESTECRMYPSIYFVNKTFDSTKEQNARVSIFLVENSMIWHFPILAHHVFVWKSILFCGCSSMCSTASAAALAFVEFPRFWCCFCH